LKEGRDWFLAEMQSLGFATLPSHSSFLHVNFGSKAEAVHGQLADKVLYRSNFAHPALAGYSRFSATTKACFGPVVEWIREAAQR
jgi:histidinol-phosphate aminotransferase